MRRIGGPGVSRPADDVLPGRGRRTSPAWPGARTMPPDREAHCGWWFRPVLRKRAGDRGPAGPRVERSLPRGSGSGAREPTTASASLCGGGCPCPTVRPGSAGVHPQRVVSAVRRLRAVSAMEAGPGAVAAEVTYDPRQGWVSWLTIAAAPHEQHQPRGCPRWAPARARSRPPRAGAPGVSGVRTAGMPGMTLVRPDRSGRDRPSRSRMGDTGFRAAGPARAGAAPVAGGQTG
jgi:hypothetical protein